MLIVFYNYRLFVVVTVILITLPKLIVPPLERLRFTFSHTANVIVPFTV